MRTRSTYTLLLFLGRPGRARAQGPLPGTQPLGSTIAALRLARSDYGHHAPLGSQPSARLSGGDSSWHRGFRHPFESGLQSLEEGADLVTGGVRHGGGGGCACPGQSKLSSIATTKHAVSHGPCHPASQGAGRVGEWQRGRERSQDSLQAWQWP